MGKSTISMAIFNSYVKLPDDTQLMDSTGSFRIQWVHLKESERGTTGRLSGQAGAPLRKPAWTNWSRTSHEAEPVIKYRQVSSSIIKYSQESSNPTHQNSSTDGASNPP
jgi:hypothetical protein